MLAIIHSGTRKLGYLINGLNYVDYYKYRDAIISLNLIGLVKLHSCITWMASLLFICGLSHVVLSITSLLENYHTSYDYRGTNLVTVQGAVSRRLVIA